MAKLFKILNWIVLILTSIVALFAGYMIFGIQTGSQEDPGAGFTLLFLMAWLGIFGILSIILGAIGFFNARRAKTITPLVHSLCLVVGALALLMGVYYGTQ